MKKHSATTDDYSELNKAEHIASLVAGYIRQSLDDTEHDELDEWIALKDDNMVLFEEITDEKKLYAELEIFEKSGVTEALTKCIGKIGFKK